MARGVGRRVAGVRRLRPFLVVAALVVGALVALNLVLVGLSGPVEPALRRAEVLDPGEYERVGRQIAAVERLLGADSTDERSLVVVTGLSTAREDIDGETLGRAVCGGSRVLNLGSSGGSFRELEFYLRPLEGSTLSSSLTILSVHPVWLAGRLALPSASTESFLPGVASQSVLRRFRRYRPWILANRRPVHAVVMDALWWFRSQLASRFALQPHEIFARVNDSPWRPRISYHGARATDEAMEEQLVSWRDLGWFNAESFSAGGAEALHLRRVLDEAESLGGPLIVVLMPEHSAMRERVPPSAERAFRESLAGRHYRALLDLRRALPDGDFYDYAHLNAHGRRQLSLILGQRLETLASCRAAQRTGAAAERVRA